MLVFRKANLDLSMYCNKRLSLKRKKDREREMFKCGGEMVKIGESHLKRARGTWQVC